MSGERREGLGTRAAETVFLLALPVFSGFYLWQAGRIPQPPGNIAVGPRTVPLLIGWVMLAVALLQVFIRFRPSAGERGSGGDSISDWSAVWLVLGIFLLLIVLVERLGFVLAVGLFISGLSTFFARSRWVGNVLTGFMFAVAVYLLFTRVLGIELPEGVLKGLL